MSLEQNIKNIAQEAKNACRAMRTANCASKNQALYLLADALDRKRKTIIAKNQLDLKQAESMGRSSAFIDRLTISNAVVDGMIRGLVEIQALTDPVGEIRQMHKRPNGLTTGRIRIPIGVVGFIYESRPNVTVDAAALCLKSGNTVILKGGSEAINSNLALGEIIGHTLDMTDLPPKAVQVIPSTEREAVNHLLEMDDFVDLIIPRGGEGLIRFVVQHSRIPVLKHYKGVCHVYVDKAANLKNAEAICLNAKVQRPGVCNAMETLLVHKKIAGTFLPSLEKSLNDAGVEIRGCSKTRAIISKANPAVASDWSEEYLDLILSIKVVDNVDEALDHIETFGSNHTEAIITNDYSRAQRFLNTVDASAVMVNASTRFNDGHQLGLGAEIGISTSKLHAYGPMGLEELTSSKFIVFGEGHVRE